jgi:hypothetical protein
MRVVVYVEKGVVVRWTCPLGLVTSDGRLMVNGGSMGDHRRNRYKGREVGNRSR